MHFYKLEFSKFIILTLHYINFQIQFDSNYIIPTLITISLHHCFSCQITTQQLTTQSGTVVWWQPGYSLAWLGSLFWSITPLIYWRVWMLTWEEGRMPKHKWRSPKNSQKKDWKGKKHKTWNIYLTVVRKTGGCLVYE